jgi:hypothetical protein
VEPKSVDLDDEPLVAPHEVDLVAADADVDLGRRELRSPDQGEEALLGLRAGQCGGAVVEEGAEGAGAGEG